MNRCPTHRQLAQAFTEGPSVSIQNHLDICDACLEEWRATEKVIETAKRLPDGIPGPDHLMDAEQKLLAAALSVPNPSRRRYMLPAVAAAVAAFVCGAVLFLAQSEESQTVSSEGDDSDHKGTIVAKPGTRYTHSCERDGKRRDETVHVADGSVTVTVAPLGERDRFRVLTGDAEVEVRGTIFTVVVSSGQLIEVSVTSGKVQVRPHYGDEVLLTAGGRWRKASRAPLSEPEALSPTDAGAQSLPSSVGGRSTGGRREASKRSPSKRSRGTRVGGDDLFKSGWALFKSGDFRGAAEQFDEAVLVTGPKPNAQDIYFWRAVSHFRARTSRAGRALEAFLDAFPLAPRREEIRAMYGWYLLESGRPDAAAEAFRAAAESPDGRVRESARKGLRRAQSKQAE